MTNSSAQSLTDSKKLALVTGANRGLGLQTVHDLLQKGYQVILAARDLRKGEAAAAKLSEQGLNPLVEELDVSNESSIAAFAKRFQAKYDRLDVLVNNAGVYLDGANGDFSNVPAAVVQQTFLSNVVGPYLLCQFALPLMQAQKSGRIVNVSSGMGQLSEMGPNAPAYRISKTALNGLTKNLAEVVKGTPDILVNAVCPGWVKTDMGGAGATRTLEQGASGIVWAATLAKGGPSGGFYRDGQLLAW